MNYLIVFRVELKNLFMSIYIVAMVTSSSDVRRSQFGALTNFTETLFGNAFEVYTYM